MNNCCNDEKEEKKDCGCIYDILKKILLLQQQDFDNESYSGCDKPYLGPICTSVCYNTRPIQLFNCSTGAAWSFPYNVNGTIGDTDVFRIEALDECCCTCRLLYLNPTTNQYTNTNEFATIDLGCVGAIRCLADTFIDLC